MCCLVIEGGNVLTGVSSEFNILFKAPALHRVNEHKGRQLGQRWDLLLLTIVALIQIKIKTVHINHRLSIKMDDASPLPLIV